MWLQIYKVKSQFWVKSWICLITFFSHIATSKGEKYWCIMWGAKEWNFCHCHQLVHIGIDNRIGNVPVGNPGYSFISACMISTADTIAMGVKQLLCKDCPPLNSLIKCNLLTTDDKIVLPVDMNQACILALLQEQCILHKLPSYSTEIYWECKVAKARQLQTFCNRYT